MCNDLAWIPAAERKWIAFWKVPRRITRKVSIVYFFVVGAIVFPFTYCTL